MKPILTHLLALVAGVLIVWLATPKPESPAPKSPDQKTARSTSRSLQPSKPTHNKTYKAPPLTPDEALEAKLESLIAKPPTRDNVEAYLTQNNRSTESLIGASLALSDFNYIREALKADPDNPHLLYLAAAQNDGTPEERLAWAKQLTEVQPNNAFASYILAGRAMESGDPDSALAAMRKALDQQELSDFSDQSMLHMKEAFIGTGSPRTTASLTSAFNLPSPGVFETVRLSKSLLAHSSSLDEASQDEVRIMMASMGVRMTEDLPTKYLLSEVAGIGIQLNSLKGLDESAPSPFEGYNSSEVQDLLKQRQTEIRESMPDTNGLIRLAAQPNSDELINSFTDRVRTFGEYEAQLWLGKVIESLPE